MNSNFFNTYLLWLLHKQRFYFLLLLVLFGCGRERNENGLNSTECRESGGEWVYVNDCPSPCDPPTPTSENCATIHEMVCITVCSEEPSCNCPQDKPFWLNGCVGFDECPNEDWGVGQGIAKQTYYWISCHPAVSIDWKFRKQFSISDWFQSGLSSSVKERDQVQIPIW